MRTGIDFTVSHGDRQRLEAIVADRNSSQKHVWRARIVLLWARHQRDHGRDRDVEDDGLALAGAVHAGGR